MLKPVIAVFLAALLSFAAARAETAASLDDLSFLSGHWRGGAGEMTFEEIWSAPGGGVMTGMARGHTGQRLNVLEYIVVSEEDGRLLMRFKHFNADYSTWETDGPLELVLTRIATDDAIFEATRDDAEVASIRYWKPTEETLQADVVLIENGEEGGFTLNFSKAE